MSICPDKFGQVNWFVKHRMKFVNLGDFGFNSVSRAYGGLECDASFYRS